MPDQNGGTALIQVLIYSDRATGGAAMPFLKNFVVIHMSSFIFLVLRFFEAFALSDRS